MSFSDFKSLVPLFYSAVMVPFTAPLSLVPVSLSNCQLAYDWFCYIMVNAYWHSKCIVFLGRRNILLCHNGVQSTLVAQIVFSLRRICNLCVKVVAYQLQGPSNTIGEFNSVFVCNGYIINSDEQAVQSQRLWLGWQLITISLSAICGKLFSSCNQSLNGIVIHHPS